MDLSRKSARIRLLVRREPYWQRLAPGAHLGFRRGPDTWLLRHRPAKGKRRTIALTAAQDFDDAKPSAEELIAQLSQSPVRAVKRGTVKAALEAYLANLTRHNRDQAAKEALGRFKRHVYPDPLAEVQLESATKDDFLEWRDRLKKGREPRTVNRNVRALVAALNCAVQDLGHVGNPRAWKFAPLADDVEQGGETAVFLDATQRKALIAASPPNPAAFLRALELTGARPKELAEAKVRDLDGSTLRLAHKKGRPPKVRIRHVVLSPDAAAFFARQARGKLPTAPLFTEDGDTPWRRHVWARDIRAAIADHNKKAKGASRIPPAATAYSFRHARISELLQLHGIDPLTVAQQTGTSLAMIESTYLRFIPSAMAEKLVAVKA